MVLAMLKQQLLKNIKDDGNEFNIILKQECFFLGMVMTNVN